MKRVNGKSDRFSETRGSKETSMELHNSEIRWRQIFVARYSQMEFNALLP